MNARDRGLQVAKEMATCRHFKGIQHKKCEAGVVYDSFKGLGPLWKVLPCMGPGSCASKSTPTQEEAEAAADAREAHIAAFLAKTNLGVCGTCDDRSTDWKQAGHCIYSVPCGHRVGQGDAKKYKAGVLEARAKEQQP